MRLIIRVLKREEQIVLLALVHLEQLSMEGMSELPLTSIAICGVTVSNAVLVTSDRTDFILSKRAFGRMVQTTDAAVSLLSLGIVDMECRRVGGSIPSD
ncbi:hypothetical protein ACE6H2_005616 [Prunus campanulata]